MSDTYRIKAHCKNCYFRMGTSGLEIDIPKGIRVYPFLSWEKCPQCGCVDCLVQKGILN